jgi:PTH1 family peptidyl-tRNA hydrolase
MTERIRIIAGLGNPGQRYETTRHNAGYWLVEALAQRHGGQFKSEAKFHGDVAAITVNGADVRLLRPGTYMNKSGLAVAALARYLKVPPASVLVAHDELDLEPGTVRLKLGGGPGGHNGLKDVIAHLGRDFYRLRIGIGHPGHRDDVIDYVLNRASAADQGRIDEAVAEAAAVIPVLLGEGDQKAMHALHSRGAEPRPYRKAGEGGGGSRDGAAGDSGASGDKR